MCLLESCSQVEFDKIVEAIGGADRTLLLLNGKWGMSKSYAVRIAAIRSCHDAHPYEPQYVADMTIQRASKVSRGGRSPGRPGLHSSSRATFDAKIRHAAKDTAIKTRKVVRKSACCLFTGIYVAIFTLLSLTLYAWFYAIPRTLWPYWGKTWNWQRFKGLLIIFGVVVLASGLTFGVALLLWVIISEGKPTLGRAP